MYPSALIAGLQMPWWGDGGHMMGMYWVWWLFWLPVLVGLIWALTRMYRERGDGRGSGDASAEERLRRRFAEGEIDEEEFRRRLDVLREADHRG